MAISTALRFRNKSEVESAGVQDFIAGLVSNVFDRTVTETVSISDDSVATYFTIRAGDRIENVLDGDQSFNAFNEAPLDSISVGDSITVVKSTRKTLSDFVRPSDAGFITDKDFLRFRLLADNFLLSDGFQKTITRTDFSIVNKVTFDSIDVTDTALSATAGISIRLVSDSLSLTDFAATDQLKQYPESFDAVDTSMPLRFVNRILSDSLSLSEDILVSRSAIINSQTLTDSISVTDLATATFISGQSKSAKILHGIEVS